MRHRCPGNICGRHRSLISPWGHIRQEPGTALDVSGLLWSRVLVDHLMSLEGLTHTSSQIGTALNSQTDVFQGLLLDWRQEIMRNPRCEASVTGQLSGLIAHVFV